MKLKPYFKGNISGRLGTKILEMHENNFTATISASFSFPKLWKVSQFIKFHN